eukprot:388304-Hanusia_phi.AAC.1
MRTAIQAITYTAPTNERLRQWGRHDTGLCSWCSTKETWTHVQLECKEFSRAIQAAHNSVARVLQEEL